MLLRIFKSIYRKLKPLLSPVLERILPAQFRYRIWHLLWRSLFQRHMRKALAGFYCAVAPGPTPSHEVVLRTSTLDEPSLSPLLIADYNFAGTYQMLHAWLVHLEEHGVNLRTIGAILEIGCGGARLIRHFRCMEGVRLVGTDINAENISWCKENILGIEFYVNDPHPPLRMIDDNTFDLIIAASVFTHIPLDLQSAWLHELKRVLKPGGIFLCTVVGKHHIQAQLDAKNRETLTTVGHVELVPDQLGLSLSSQVTGQYDVFQTRAEVIRIFGFIFSLLDYTRGGQDLLILQKLA